jgi:hypothetical protein
MPEDLTGVVRSQIESWMTELAKLSRNPRVRKFMELRQKIDEADAFVIEANAPALSNRSSPFDPYDAFEFAQDLSGREVSTLELSKLAFGRFPDMSNESRSLMIHYLIDNGMAAVARKTESGHPTWYRFGSSKEKGTLGTWRRLGIPGNELSGLKSDDLEDLIAVPVGRR